MSKKGVPRGISSPKKLGIWLPAINSAAPAVKPITTVCEIKFTSAPMRAKPKISWNKPVKKVSVSTMLMNCGLPGVAKALTEANTAIEIAVVGPETKCQLEPNMAAIIVGTIAAYKPYSGGSPAIVAKATPCGNTINAPVKPAVRSARAVVRLTMGHQRKKGSSLYSQSGQASEVFKADSW